MEPVRINIVFDAQGNAQLQRAAQSLGVISRELGALSGHANAAGRALRIMENDLNRFAFALHRTTSQGLVFFNTAFEKTFSLFSQITRFSFYAFIGQIAALGFGLQRLGSEFFKINEQFAGLEITLKSMFGSLTAARQIREELTKITITSPLPFKDLADAVRAAAAMPSLAPRFSQQIAAGDLSSEKGFLRQYIHLLEQLTTFRPDKTTSDAVFALREALSGELRSLVRRFEFPPALLVQATGTPLEVLKQRPEEMFAAMKAAMDRLISPAAIKELVRQPSKLFENIIEQAFQIPLLQLGRAGEGPRGEGQSLYKSIIDFGVSSLARFGEFANVQKGPFGKQAETMGGKLTVLFERLVGIADTLLEKALRLGGAGPTDVPGAGKIERVYTVFQNIISYIVDVGLPMLTKGFQRFIEITGPLFRWYATILKQVTNILLFAFEKGGPIVGLFSTIFLKSLPQILNQFLLRFEDSFIKTFQNVRAGMMAMVTTSAILPGMIASGAAGRMGLRGADVAGTLANAVRRNPFLANQELLAQSGMAIQRGQLVHATGGQRTGYYGQAYTAVQGARVAPQELPRGYMFQQGQRPEDILGRRRIIFDPTRNQYVWGFGNAGNQPFGRPVAAGTLATLVQELDPFRSGTRAGLPRGVTPVVGAAGLQFRGPTGAFVGADWVNRRVAQAIAPTPGLAYRATFQTMREAGSGPITSRVGAGIAGGLTAVGFGPAAAGRAAGFLAGGAAAMASAIAPVLMILAGTAAFTWVLDKAMGYLEKKRADKARAELEAMGLGPKERGRITERATMEGGLSRSVTEFIKGVQTQGEVAQKYMPAVVSFLSERAKVQVPTMVTERTPEQMRALIAPGAAAVSGYGYLGMERVLAPKVKALQSIQFIEKQLDFEGLFEFRAKLQKDIVNLAEKFKTGKEPAPFELESLTQIGETGLPEPFKVTSRKVMGEVQAALNKVWVDTQGSADALIKRIQELFKSPEGAPLFPLALPFTEGDLSVIDRAKDVLENLKSPAGFRAVSKQMEKINQGFKAFEGSADFKQIISDAETALTAFRSTFEPFYNVHDIFQRLELPRLANLVKLGEDIKKLGVAIGDQKSPMEQAIEEQRNNILKSIESVRSTKRAKRVVGAGGEPEVVMMVESVDKATGKITEVTAVAFEEYAKKFVEQYDKESKTYQSQMMQQVEAFKVQVPASLASILSVGMRESLTELQTAGLSVATRIVGQLKENFELFGKAVKDAAPERLTEDAMIKYRELFESLDAIAGTPIRADTNALERQIAELGRLRQTKEVSTRWNALISSVSRGGDIMEVISKTITPQLSTEIKNSTVAAAQTLTKLTHDLNLGVEAMTRTIQEMQWSRLEKAFQNILSGSMFRTELGTEQEIKRSQEFIQKEYKFNMPTKAYDWLSLPPDTRKGEGPREQGLVDYYGKYLIPGVEEQLAKLRAGAPLTPEDTGREEKLQTDLQSFYKTYNDLLRARKKTLADEFMQNLTEALDSIREMTDPELGFKVGRGGTVKPSIGWQGGRFPETDPRLKALMDRYTELNQKVGGRLGIVPQFTEALEVDTRGFRAVTGEVERLIGFQKEYIELARILREMSKEPVLDKYSEDLNKLAASWSKMAIEAERAKEAITGRGGVLQSMTEGFGAVVSQWEASAANWTSVGAGIAESLSSELSKSLLDIAINSKNAGEAFRDFGAAISETAARLAMNKTVEMLLGIGFGAIGSLIPTGGGALQAGTAGTTTGPFYAPGGAPATVTPGFHSVGGLIPGTPSNKDSHPALLAPGEFVIPSGVVSKYGAEHFEAYRKGTMKGYAMGGLVQSLPVNSVSMTPAMTVPRGTGLASVSAPVNVVVNINNGTPTATTTQTAESVDEQSQKLARSLQASVREQLIREQRQGGALYYMARGGRAR